QPAASTSGAELERKPSTVIPYRRLSIMGCAPSRDSSRRQEPKPCSCLCNGCYPYLCCGAPPEGQTTTAYGESSAVPLPEGGHQAGSAGKPVMHGSHDYHWIGGGTSGKMETGASHKPETPAGGAAAMAHGEESKVDVNIVAPSGAAASLSAEANISAAGSAAGDSGKIDSSAIKSGEMFTSTGGSSSYAPSSSIDPDAAGSVKVEGAEGQTPMEWSASAGDASADISGKPPIA
ncbi:unnamed protein product, partial [Ectocarpus sp. 12 AP-2014]